MTSPDIRERAERLLDEVLANERHILSPFSSADLISQALLEAHEAGRAEMAGDITETVNEMMLHTKAIRQEGPADMERAGRVMAKLLDGYVAIAKLIDATAIRSIK